MSALPVFNKFTSISEETPGSKLPITDSTSITGASVAYAGGGGAGMRNVPGGQSCVPTAGGDGGGGPGGGTNTPYPRPAAAGTGGNGTDNTGGGGGGGSRHGPGGGNTSPGGTGGSGVVIIRYKYQ